MVLVLRRPARHADSRNHRPHADSAVADAVLVAPEPHRAAILAVDDEPSVLAAVARDLRRGFGEHYRILRAGSGPDALELLNEMRRRGENLAMIVADQRMPGMEGTELLLKARQIYPDAKRVLLTAYADTSA